jgi:hypothetical protein
VKFDTFSKYDPRRVALAERAFLTVWAGLGVWREDMVLVGGLAPKYLCGDVTAVRSLPRPVTLDADIGITLGASAGQYGRLLDHLAAQGFVLTNDEFGAMRFMQVIEGYRVFVDFLVEDPRGNTGTVIVDSIPANIMPGVNRALEKARLVDVEGIDLFGAKQNLTIRVCEVGPFLALKLRAFGSRQQPKDAFDILYTLSHYDAGTVRAVCAFAEEAACGNSAMNDALQCLMNHFVDENSPGPLRAAYFVHGRQVPGEPGDVALQRIMIRQDMVDAANQLRNAIDRLKP